MNVDITGKVIQAVDSSDVVVNTAAENMSVEAGKTTGTKETASNNGDANGANGQEQRYPSKTSIDSLVSALNNKLTTTHCQYKYNDAVKMVSIKIMDNDTGKVIREIPPEKSLEALQKMLERAGIIVDEKR